MELSLLTWFLEPKFSTILIYVQKVIGTFQFLQWSASCGRRDRILLSLYQAYHIVRFSCNPATRFFPGNPGSLHLLSTTLSSRQIQETDAYSKLAQPRASLWRKLPARADLGPTPSHWQHLCILATPLQRVMSWERPSPSGHHFASRCF